MANFDQANDLSPAQSLVPAAYTANANGTGVDLQGFEAATVIVDVGAITDGTHVVSLEESDDDSTYSAVAAADLLGSFPASLSANSVYKVGYRGSKRYIRAVTAVSGATNGAVYGASIVRGRPQVMPAA